MPLAIQSISIMIARSTRSQGSMKVFKISYLTEFRLRMLWFNLRCTFTYLHHQEELTGLLAWAQRKRLNGPRRLYEFRLRQVEDGLYQIQKNEQFLVILCEFLYTAYRQLSPKVYRKGYAAKYKGCYT